MVAEPAETPVTTPLAEFIVATPVLLEVQVPPVVVNDSVVVPFEHIAIAPPLYVPTVAGAVMVTSLVAVALEHPPVPVFVYVIVTVPETTPEAGLTSPDVAFTVAKVKLPEDQVPPVEVDVNVVVWFAQIVWLPLNVPAFGAAVTVTVLFAVALLHPPVPATV